MKKNKLNYRTGIKYFIFSFIIYFIGFWIYTDYRLINFSKEWRRFRTISLFLDEYHLKCNAYPTTEEGLNAISTNKNCSLNLKKTKEDFFNNTENSTMLYFSNGKKYHFIIYKNSYGKYENSAGSLEKE